MALPIGARDDHHRTRYFVFQEQRRNTDLHVFERGAKANQMEPIHRDEQAPRVSLAHDPGDLVLFVLGHQQSVAVRDIEFLLSFHTRVHTGHVGRPRRSKTNVSNVLAKSY